MSSGFLRDVFQNCYLGRKMILLNFNTKYFLNVLVNFV